MKCPCEVYDEDTITYDGVGVCSCGHVDDEHDDSFLSPCTVEVD